MQRISGFQKRKFLMSEIVVVGIFGFDGKAIV